MGQSAGEKQENSPRSTHNSTGRAWGSALVVLVVSVLTLAIIPNQMLSYLSLHVAPHTCDLLVMAWFTVAFIFSCWLFVRLQRPRKEAN